MVPSNAKADPPFVLQDPVDGTVVMDGRWYEVVSGGAVVNMFSTPFACDVRSNVTRQRCIIPTPPSVSQVNSSFDTYVHVWAVYLQPPVSEHPHCTTGSMVAHVLPKLLPTNPVTRDRRAIRAIMRIQTAAVQHSDFVVNQVFCKTWTGVTFSRTALGSESSRRPQPTTSWSRRTVPGRSECP